MRSSIKICITLCATFFLVISNALYANEPTVWDGIRQSFQLDHHVNSSRVRTEIRKLTADKKNFNRILTASTPYLYYIYQETKARHLPAEIAFIPFVESEFSPNDYSNKNALGLWQLTPNTARLLGLQKGKGDRRDVVLATKAALTHFKYLGSYFKGNWCLAIAAYNCGEGRVRSAMRYADSRNYWDLYLPRETSLYVPKLLAVAEIIKNPKKYGVELPPIPNHPYFKELKIKKPASFTQIAHSLNVSVKSLYALNPQYKYETYPHKVDKLFVPIKIAV